MPTAQGALFALRNVDTRLADAVLERAATHYRAVAPPDRSSFGSQSPAPPEECRRGRLTFPGGTRPPRVSVSE